MKKISRTTINLKRMKYFYSSTDILNQTTRFVVIIINHQKSHEVYQHEQQLQFQHIRSLCLLLLLLAPEIWNRDDSHEEKESDIRNTWLKIMAEDQFPAMARVNGVGEEGEERSVKKKINLFFFYKMGVLFG